MTSLERTHRRLREISVHELREIADQHSAISGKAAFLAAERAARSDVQALHRMADTLDVADSPEACRRADGRFHIEIAATAQSARLTRQEIALQSEIGDLLWMPSGSVVSRSHSLRQHHEILDAIRDGDGPRARDLADTHVQQGIDKLIELHLELAAGPDSPEPEAERGVR